MDYVIKWEIPQNDKSVNSMMKHLRSRRYSSEIELHSNGLVGVFSTPKNLDEKTRRVLAEPHLLVFLGKFHANACIFLLIQLFSVVLELTPYLSDYILLLVI